MQAGMVYEGLRMNKNRGRSPRFRKAKFGVFGSKWVKKLFYKISIAVVSTGVKYDTFVLAADEDIRVLFHCVGVFRRSEYTSRMRSWRLVSIVLGHQLRFIARLPRAVISPSFAADLDRTEALGSVPLENPGVWQQAFEVDTGGGMIHDVQGFEEPDRVENAMRDDDSDQEPVDIIGDNDDSTGANPHKQHGPSSSGIQQYPPHFSTLNLEALGQQADGGATVGSSSTEFQIGQSFQNKDEAVLSVKDYSICGGVEYRVLKSDYLKYHGKCKEFGKGCSWLILILLRARKGTWKVRRYNGPHTCLATSISSDHRQLDYHERLLVRTITK
ncbi:uncharacterized protein LOC107478464 [Arachis duranensis]|uniref:Uncharacterized protein LOC107478464 n=1 Tax=Arachis duranensis TaxID=130453 RepID=A0A6P4CP76_ARADU|nr:uncharacterized protein LOC107478464 [Arachis duranensis]